MMTKSSLMTMTTNKVMIDFQEAAFELKENYLELAYAEYQGKLWKMKRHGYTGRLTFYFKAEEGWYVAFPPPELYFVKWQPVRNK